MIKMVDPRTIKGLLLLELDPEEIDNYHAIEDWFLSGTVEWNGTQTDVRIRLDTILNEFDGHDVEISIKSLKGPDTP